MSLPPPPRLLPFLMLALTVIFLLPTTALADVGLPLVTGDGILLLLGLTPIVFIEGWVLRRSLGVAKGAAISAAASANVLSTALGLVGIGGVFFIQAQRPIRVIFHSNAEYYLPILFWLVPLFFISWLVEYPVIRSKLGDAQPRPIDAAGAMGTARPKLRRSDVLLASFEANFASYAFMALVVGVLWAVEPVPTPQGGPSPAVTALRAINAAETEYSMSYNGFSADLTALSWPTNSIASQQHTSRIDSQLATAEKDGYRFVYTPHFTRHEQVDGYSVRADPNRPGSGNDFYYTDKSGDVYVSESGPANSSDRMAFAFHLMLSGEIKLYSLGGPQQGFRPEDESHIVGPVRALYTIFRAERKYSLQYPDGTGFSPSLAALGGPEGCRNPSAQAACLIDSELSIGQKDGYRFIYNPHHPQDGITGYSINANPIQPGEWRHYYYTDQTGVIRANATRPASAEDNPLAG